MAIHELYSTRKKHAESSGDDVFQYDALPSKLRTQVVNIIRDAGTTVQVMEDYYDCPLSPLIVKQLRHEHGVDELVDRAYWNNNVEELFLFIRHERDTEKVLDAIELSVLELEKYYKKYYKSGEKIKYLKDQILELNYRFR